MEESSLELPVLRARVVRSFSTVMVDDVIELIYCHATSTLNLWLIEHNGKYQDASESVFALLDEDTSRFVSAPFKVKALETFGLVRKCPIQKGAEFIVTYVTWDEKGCHWRAIPVSETRSIPISDSPVWIPPSSKLYALLDHGKPTEQLLEEHKQKVINRFECLLGAVERELTADDSMKLFHWVESFEELELFFVVTPTLQNDMHELLQMNVPNRILQFISVTYSNETITVTHQYFKVPPIHINNVNRPITPVSFSLSDVFKTQHKQTGIFLRIPKVELGFWNTLTSDDSIPCISTNFQPMPSPKETTTEVECTSGINKLSSDCISCILEQLPDFYHLMRCKAVCKKWKRLIENESLWARRLLHLNQALKVQTVPSDVSFKDLSICLSIIQTCSYPSRRPHEILQRMKMPVVDPKFCKMLVYSHLSIAKCSADAVFHYKLMRVMLGIEVFVTSSELNNCHILFHKSNDTDDHNAYISIANYSSHDTSIPAIDGCVIPLSAAEGAATLNKIREYLADKRSERPTCSKSFTEQVHKRLLWFWKCGLLSDDTFFMTLMSCLFQLFEWGQPTGLDMRFSIQLSLTDWFTGMPRKKGPEPFICTSDQFIRSAYLKPVFYGRRRFASVQLKLQLCNDFWSLCKIARKNL